MAVMAPEAVGAAGGAAGDAASGAVGFILGRPRGGDGGGGGGSSAGAFMIAIILLGLAMMGFWVAFHGPDKLQPDQFPGLFRMFLQWVNDAENMPSWLAGPSSSKATVAPNQNIGAAVGNTLQQNMPTDGSAEQIAGGKVYNPATGQVGGGGGRTG